MRLLRVLPVGFFSYGEHGWIDLDNKGIVLLQGPVGSGKSSLFDVIAEVLYGTSPKRDGTRDVSESDIVNVQLGRACGAVEFMVGPHRYRVAYLRNWSGPAPLPGPSAQEGAGEYGGTTVYFERWDGSRWVQQGPDGRDLRYPKMADTWACVEEVTGLSYAAFCSSCYVPQDRALAFVRGKNAEREGILTTLMQLGRYDEATDRAKEKVAENKQQLAGFDGVLTTLRWRLSNVPEARVEDLRDQVLQAEAAALQCAKQLQELQEQVDTERVLAEGRARAAAKLRETLADLNRQIQEQALATGSLRAEMDRARLSAEVALRALPTMSPELEAASREKIAAGASVDAENRRLAGMLPGAGTCQSCGSVLDEKTLARHKEEQARRVQIEKGRLSVAEEEEAVCRQRLSESVARERQRADSNRDRQLAEIEARQIEQAAKLVTFEAQRAALQAEIVDKERPAASSDLAAQVARLQQAQRQADATLASLRTSLALAEQHESQRVQLALAVAVKEKEQAALDLDQTEWAWLSKHLPRVKQMKFAAGSGLINEALARHLAVLTGGTTRVTLQPFRLKKEAVKKPEGKRTADDYVFEFNMQVEEGDKESVPIQLYSGGEKERMTLALVLALWELAASRGETSVLLLDEVLSYLDEGSIEKFVHLLEGLRRQVQTVILVGHDPTLAALLRPDEVWQAVKRDGATTIEVAL